MLLGSLFHSNPHSTAVPSLLSSAHCVYPCLLFFPHTSSAIQLLPICFLINYHPHTPPPHPYSTMAFSVLPLQLSPFSFFQHSFFCLTYLSKQRGKIVQCRKPNPPLLQQLQKDVSSFFLGRTGEAVPPTGLYHTQQQQHQTAVRGQIER